MIPFTGIINGLFVLVLLVPPYLFALLAQETRIYQFIFYGVLTILLILFYVKGRNWRNWFYENMQHRSNMAMLNGDKSQGTSVICEK